MSFFIEETLVYRVETEEYIFEQWDFTVTAPAEADSKIRTI